MAQSLTKKSFYGSNKRMKSIDIRAKIERRLKDFKQNPLPRKYKQRLAASSVWQIFYKQADAFSYMKRMCQKELHVFSFESKVFFEHHGQRLYLVTSYEHFWHYYSQLCEEKRYYYEVIPEGAVCHLYFDLEFSKDFNPASNGAKMVETFIKVVQWHLKKQFNIKCSRNNIIQLDSSSDVKFSQHLIVRIPQAAFKDNINAGNFVKKICNGLASVPSESDGKKERSCGYEELGLSLQDIQDIFVFNKDGDKSVFCDTGVYTKNRNFRLYLSSKLNKNTPLKLVEEGEFQPITDHKKIFFDSLVANVQYEPGLRILCDEEAVKPLKEHITVQRKSKDYGPTVVEGYRHSPYLEIDTFIESVITKSGSSGKIRRWTYFHQGELLVYDISHNRWCYNIGREHKSNNVMLMVDIRRGIYYQKCHDSDCKANDFKSPEWKLPDDILPGYYVQQEIFDSDFHSDEKKEASSNSGRLSADDYDMYFDTDDQELLEAMNNYEVNLDINPDWFCDMDEDQFNELPTQRKSERKLSLTSNTSKEVQEKNAKQCKSSDVDFIVESGSNENKDPDSSNQCTNQYVEDYIDPSWFEEDLT